MGNQTFHDRKNKGEKKETILAKNEQIGVTLIANISENDRGFDFSLMLPLLTGVVPLCPPV